MAGVTAGLPDLVRDKWASLLSNGFTLVTEEPRHVVLTSARLRIDVSHDPRGEVDVQVFLPGQEPWQGWSYMGMVGNASVGRLLELALDEMQAEPAVLSGDAAFYADLAAAQRARSIEYTRWAEGKGPAPRPRRGRLP